MADSREPDPADALAAMASGSAGGRVGDDDGGGADGDDRAASASSSDDILAAPAPDASVFAPRRPTRDLRAERQIHNRRTLIPILLTCGVLMPAVGALKWLRGPDSPFAAWPVWVPIVLGACGVVLLLLAAGNMMQVRQMMRGAKHR
jgi:hypothetical protein